MPPDNRPLWERLKETFKRRLPTPENFGKDIAELGLEDEFGTALDVTGLSSARDFFVENPAWVKAGAEKAEEIDRVGDPGRPFDDPIEERAFRVNYAPWTSDEDLRRERALRRGMQAGVVENVPKVFAPADVASLGMAAGGRGLMTAGRSLPGTVRAGRNLMKVGALADQVGDVTAMGFGGMDVAQGIAEKDPAKAAGGALMVGLGGLGQVAGRKLAKATEVPEVEEPQDLSDLGSSFDEIFKDVDVDAPSTTAPRPEIEEPSIDDILSTVEQKPSEVPSHLRTPLDEVQDETIRKRIRDTSRQLAREFADTGVVDEARFGGLVDEDLAPYQDLIRRQAILESSALMQGRTLLEDLRGWHGDEGDEGLMVYRSSNDPTSFDVVQRAGGRVVGGAQVRKNKLDMIAGGKAMDSPRTADEIQDLLDELGVERGDVLTVLGAQARRKLEARHGQRSAGVGAVEESPRRLEEFGRTDEGPVVEAISPRQTEGVGAGRDEGELDVDVIEGLIDEGSRPSLVPKSPPAGIAAGQQGLLQGPSGDVGAGGPGKIKPGGAGGGRGRPPNIPPGRVKVPRIANRPSHNIKQWINSRHAADIEGAVARRDFEDLRQEGPDWIQRYEAGGAKAVKGGEKVKQFFADRLAHLRSLGVPIQEAENYITHVWADDPEKVRMTFRRLGIRPGFTQERVFQTYKAGLDAGLTPKYDNIADVVGSYEARYRKLVSDQMFYNFLRQNKFVKPTTSAPPDWVEVRNFPLHRFTDNRKLKHVQVWKAPPTVALAINRYLDSPISSPFKDFWQRQVQKFVDVKNVVMSSGVPLTALNAHGFNVAARIASVQSNPILAAVKYGQSVARMAHVGWARKELEEHLAEIPRYIKAGATFALEDHQFKAALEKLITKVAPSSKLERAAGGVKDFGKQVAAAAKGHEGSVVGKGYSGLRKMHEILFEDPLFQYALPASKLQFMRNYEQQLLKAGLDPKEALSLAAHQGNEVFGGINWVEEGRDPQLQTFLRLAFNAPDWAESNLRLAKGVVGFWKNPSDPRNKVYRNLMVNVASYYLFVNVLSKATSGQWAWEDAAERHLQVGAGKAESGRSRYVKPLGTGADWARLPYEVIAKLGRGDLSGTFDVVAARLHPLTQGVINLVKNRNYYGRPIAGEEYAEQEGKGKGMLKQAANIAKEVTDVAAPSYVKAPVAALAQDQSVEEILAKSVEAPVAYVRPRQSGSKGRGSRGRSRGRGRSRRD